MHSQKIGKIGEYYALQYFQMIGHLVIYHSYSSPFGEIDLITKDLHHHQLVFTEVKTRTSDYFGTADHSLTKAKLSRFRKTVFWYLQNHRTKDSWRIDFLALQLQKDLELITVTHFQNILNEPYN